MTGGRLTDDYTSNLLGNMLQSADWSRFRSATNVHTVDAIVVSVFCLQCSHTKCFRVSHLCMPSLLLAENGLHRFPCVEQNSYVPMHTCLQRLCLLGGTKEQQRGHPKGHRRDNPSEHQREHSREHQRRHQSSIASIRQRSQQKASSATKPQPPLISYTPSWQFPQQDSSNADPTLGVHAAHYDSGTKPSWQLLLSSGFCQTNSTSSSPFAFVSK